jgi:hypothetical protein
VFFPINQYYFSRLECFPCQPALFFYVGESVFPVSQYYFSRLESVFSCKPVLFF